MEMSFQQAILAYQQTIAKKQEEMQVLGIGAQIIQAQQKRIVELEQALATAGVALPDNVVPMQQEG